MKLKKLFLILLLVGFLLNTPMFTSFILAQPAPPLTYINVLAITSDGDNYVWYYPESEYGSTGYTASGSEVVLAIYVEGYTLSSSPRVYIDGVDITNEIEEPLPKDYLSGPDNIIYGYISYKSIPLDYFAKENTGTVTVFARDIHNPSVTRSATRTFNIDWNGNQMEAETFKNTIYEVDINEDAGF